MQLDHAIVLFDEIDELVREREDKAADAFGRFLTTSMLPKLAELWKSGKIMYFVATNHIEYFDRAITRSERFDAAIFVSPPSFEAKKGRLSELLARDYGMKIELAVSQKEVDSAMPDIKSICLLSKEDQERDLSQPWEKPLAKLALLRHDEISGLAYELSKVAPSGGLIDAGLLTQALSNVHDGRSRLKREYFEFQRDRDYIRRDYSKKTVWKIDGLEKDDASGMVKRNELSCRVGPDGKEVYFKISAVPDWKTVKLQGYVTDRSENGTIYARKGT